MLRISAILGLGLAALGGANAATVFAPTAIDLTKALVGVGSCATAACTPTVSTYNTGQYMNTLFTTPLPTAPPPTPSGGLQPYPTNTGITTLPLILNQQSATYGNYDTYYSANAINTDTTIVVDLGGFTGANATAGLFQVDKIWTMIQGTFENFGTQGITITLNGVAADGTTAISDQIQFKAGRDYRATNSTSVSCTDANASGGATASSCTGASSDTAQVSGSETQTVGGATNTVITYNNVYTGTNVNNYYLDVQEIDLPGAGNTGSFATGYLDSITIANISGTGTTKERMLFSGLTVDQAVPEPSTYLLFVAGLGIVAFVAMRRKKLAA
jgi:hypothetical protein